MHQLLAVHRNGRRGPAWGPELGLSGATSAMPPLGSTSGATLFAGAERELGQVEHGHGLARPVQQAAQPSRGEQHRVPVGAAQHPRQRGQRQAIKGRADGLQQRPHGLAASVGKPGPAGASSGR